MVNNLFIFWPTVLKTYLMEIQYKNTHLDFTLHGDVYFLPKDVEENHLKGEKNFYVDLQDKIISKVGNKATELTPSKLAAYHEVYSNSSYKFDKRINQENFKIIKEYIKDTEPIKIKYAVVDKSKVLFIFLCLPLFIAGLLYHFIKVKESKNVLESVNKSLDTAKKTIHDKDSLIAKGVSKDNIIKHLSEDKYSPYYSLAEVQVDKGLWYSYNASGKEKIGNTHPYDKVKWLFKDENGMTKIERQFKLDTSGIQTSSYGIGETIETALGKVHYFHLNVLNKDNRLIAKREYMCQSIAVSLEDKKNLKRMECLCTLYNTTNEGTLQLAYSGREIFVHEKENISKADFDLLKTSHLSTLQELPGEVRNYFALDNSMIKFIHSDLENYRKEAENTKNKLKKH